MHRPPHYPLGDWDQIEDPAEVASVLSRVSGLPRLNVYEAPHLYDLAYPGYLGDDRYYREVSASGRVLYLGVGTGRLFAPIARENPQARGLDCSAEMLRTLRDRHPHVRPEQLIHADAGDPDAAQAGAFDLVIAPYSFLEVVPRADAGRVLTNVARWLAPGGRFLTDEFSPFLIPFRRPGLETISFSVADHAVTIYIRYDHVAQSMHEITVIAGPSGRWVTDMTLHYLFPGDVVRMLAAAGFRDPEVLGEYTPQRFDPSRHDVVVFEASVPG